MEAVHNVDAVRDELARVLKSPAFFRSERHSRFLSFVCETTLAGEASKLNEYLIAHTVFDRGENYSPGEDSVVRRQAYTLRQKLQEYYAAEGKDDPIRIELPIGRYVPTFTGVPQVAALTAAVQAEPAHQEIVPETRVSKDRANYRKMLAALAAAAIVFSAAGWAVGHRAPTATGLDPIFAEMWGPWLSYRDGAVICFSNAITAGIRQTEAPFPADALTRGIEIREEEAEHIRRQFQLPAGGFFYINPSLAHAKMGEALGSIPLTAMLTKASVAVRATQSRYLNWSDFRNNNLILLGHDEANRWLDPILSKLPLRLGRTQVDKPRRIVNPTHKGNERAEYYPDYSKGQNPPAEDYALISMLSGIDGHHGLALINGVNTEGTQIGLEFLTDALNLRTLKAALQKLAPQHTGTWHFQAILHSELRDGVPTGIEIVALREFP